MLSVILIILKQYFFMDLYFNFRGAILLFCYEILIGINF